MSFSNLPQESQSIQTLEWFCIRTQPKHEAMTAGYLKQLHGIEVFNPRIQVERRGRGKMVWVTESLFGCYLFARFDLSLGLEKIRYTPGVSSLVSFRGKILSVAADEIEYLRLHFSDLPKMAAPNSLQVGDHITLVQGPFEGMSATVIRTLPGSRRVQLLMEFLGQSTAIEVNMDSVGSIR